MKLEAPGAPLSVQAPALYPETIEYDSRNDMFLMGSFRDGAIYRVDTAGHATRWVDDARLCSVLGLAVDSVRRRLWAVSADLGVSTRPSPEGPKNLALVSVFDLDTGAVLAHVDLAPLASGPHLLNGIALDGAGNAYVSDSFSATLFAIDAQGRARLLLHSAQFAADGVGLNGLVAHPDGYLLVIQKSDGSLYKVPLANPAQFSRVRVDRSFAGGDGVTLLGKHDLLIIANQTPHVATNAAFTLSSQDDWTSATVSAVRALGDDYPTTAVLRRGKLYVVASRLNELIQAAPAQRARLRTAATIREIGEVTTATLEPPPAPGTATAAGGIRRTLLGREPAHEPGWETRLYLIEYPPGAAAPAHVHPVAGLGWVLDGEFESAFGDEAVVTVGAGHGFVERADAPHRVFRNPSPKHALRFLVAFTLRSGDEPFRVVP